MSDLDLAAPPVSVQGFEQLTCCGCPWSRRGNVGDAADHRTLTGHSAVRVQTLIGPALGHEAAWRRKVRAVKLGGDADG